MPSLVLPEAPHYVAPPPTRAELEYADLAVIDLSVADTPRGRAALVEQVRMAMTTQGFFYVVNHGLTQTKTERIFDIADVAFSGVPENEKQLYTNNDIHAYRGYKLRQYWKLDGDIKDQVEHYNINRNVARDLHPAPLQPFLPEIAAFARHNHFNVLHPILRLLALGLELPEDAFVNLHGFDTPSETSVRFMKYYPRSQEEEEKTRNVWLKGHTDFGSVTILWSQPVAGLQILSPDKKWRWIKHINNALVINIGDALEFLSGSYYKATIHRVVQPPLDQRDKARLGVFYFCRLNDNVKLTPYADSPVLKRVGIKRRFAEDSAPTMETWYKERISSYGRVELKRTDRGDEEEIIQGVLVTHYN